MRHLLMVLAAAPLLAQVPFDRIVASDKEPANWLTYSGNYQGHRYSSLSEIAVTNVSRLSVKWAYQYSDRRTEASPIVVDGVMYVTGPNTAAALDARTGVVLWEWKRPVPSDYRNIGFSRVNRGPAVLDGALYVATLDCYLVALDLKSGAVRWTTRVADYKPGYSMTLAPLAIRGKVLVGVSDDLSVSVRKGA
ncbi:MAG: PQQ-binding-like beta-propeller repeat protein, partial [Bryobacteraceae bacterium]